MQQASDKDRMAKLNHRKVQTSTTLSRRYTKRPAKSPDVMTKVQRSPQVKHFNSPMMKTGQMTTSQLKTGQMMNSNDMMRPAEMHPMQKSVNARMKQRQTGTMETPRVSAKELKEQAIQKALVSAGRVSTEGEKGMPEASQKVKTKKVGNKMHFGVGRVVLALSCAAAAVFAIAYFVNMSMPDISLRVAAMQTGMDPTYPNYVPRDYNVSSITSEDGKITMEFKNNVENGAFTLTEEKSSWDTNALVSNFVKETYGEKYTIIREQGLTIYVSGSDAAWVNGGMVYKINTTEGSLTNKQIRSIAVSM